MNPQYRYVFEWNNGITNVQTFEQRRTAYDLEMQYGARVTEIGNNEIDLSELAEMHPVNRPVAIYLGAAPEGRLSLVKRRFDIDLSYALTRLGYNIDASDWKVVEAAPVFTSIPLEDGTMFNIKCGRYKYHFLTAQY